MLVSSCTLTEPKRLVNLRLAICVLESDHQAACTVYSLGLTPLVLAASGSASAAGETGLPWEDAAVQQCPNPCSNVDLAYKLLIHDVI